MDAGHALLSTRPNRGVASLQAVSLRSRDKSNLTLSSQEELTMGRESNQMLYSSQSIYLFD